MHVSSLSIWDMQIKTTLWLHLTLIRWLKTIKQLTTNPGETVGHEKYSFTAVVMHTGAATLEIRV